MSSLVLIAREGAVTTATLNRPEKRNALNVALLQQLCAAVAAAESDRSQRILVLRGAGPVFCSGLDLLEAAEPAVADASAELIGEALRVLSTTRLVSIAAVQGAAIAGGAGLMTACDFAVATADATFGYPEIRRGIVPALIMTFLRRQVRERDAREFLLLGKLFDAGRALDAGLLNRIAADAAGLETEVRSLISSILPGAPQAAESTKKLLAELWPVPVITELERAHAQHLAARNSAEAREGIAAFNEKRPTKWAKDVA
ncbi:MAG: enoyl-CoA hydratase/isomerase family protein [Opitutaceae bacterium]